MNTELRHRYRLAANTMSLLIVRIPMNKTQVGRLIICQMDAIGVLTKKQGKMSICDVFNTYTFAWQKSPIKNV